MPVNAYGLQFEDLFQGRNKVNNVRLRIALDERKRQQDMKDAALMFDRQLGRQATFEQMRLNASAEQDERRIDAHDAAAERRLAAEHNFRIDQREADREADLIKLRESNKLDLEALKEKNKETFANWEKTHKILKADKAEGTDVATSNYLITKAELDDLDRQADSLMTLPQGEKNRIVAEVVNSLSKNENLKKAYFQSNSGSDISQNLNKLPDDIKGAAEDEIKARVSAFMAPREYQARALILQGNRRQQSLDKFIDDIDLAKARGVSLNLVPPPTLGAPAAGTGDPIEAFKAKKLGAIGQATPPEFMTVPGERGILGTAADTFASPWVEAGRALRSEVIQPLAQRSQSGLRSVRQFGQEASRNLFGTPSVQVPLPRMAGGAPTQVGQQPTGNIKLDDVVNWLSSNEPTMVGLNPMVIKAIIANPVNKDRLAGWIGKYQQSQGMAQQGAQMFGQPSDTGIYQPGQAESAIYQNPF